MMDNQNQPTEKQPPRRLSGIMMSFNRLAGDRRGVGAIEFALIAPLLISLYITAFELTIGLSVAKRVTRSAGTIADLLTREKSVDKATLATMKDLAKSLFVPYSPRDLTIHVTGVTLDASGKATVAWSWDEKNGRPYKVGSPVSVPDDVRTPNSFLVRSEVSVQHDLLMFMANLLPAEVREITITREYFYRQRVGDGVVCTDC